MIAQTCFEYPFTYYVMNLVRLVINVGFIMPSFELCLGVQDVLDSVAVNYYDLFFFFSRFKLKDLSVVN
jgi:hypothetical protein